MGMRTATCLPMLTLVFRPAIAWIPAQTCASFLLPNVFDLPTVFPFHANAVGIPFPSPGFSVLRFSGSLRQCVLFLRLIFFVGGFQVPAHVFSFPPLSL